MRFIAGALAHFGHIARLEQGGVGPTRSSNPCHETGCMLVWTTSLASGPALWEGPGSSRLGEPNSASKSPPFDTVTVEQATQTRRPIDTVNLCDVGIRRIALLVAWVRKGV